MTTLAVVLLALAAAGVALNWACVAASYNFRRRGSPRHVSMVPLIVQVLVLGSFTASSKAPSAVAPAWVFAAVALSDPALWSILYLPVFLLRRALAARKQ